MATNTQLTALQKSIFAVSLNDRTGAKDISQAAYSLSGTMPLSAIEYTRLVPDDFTTASMFGSRNRFILPQSGKVKNCYLVQRGTITATTNAFSVVNGTDFINSVSLSTAQTTLQNFSGDAIQNILEMSADGSQSIACQKILNANTLQVIGTIAIAGVVPVIWITKLPFTFSNGLENCWDLGALEKLYVDIQMNDKVSARVSNTNVMSGYSSELWVETFMMNSANETDYKNQFLMEPYTVLTYSSSTSKQPIVAGETTKVKHRINVSQPIANITASLVTTTATASAGKIKQTLLSSSLNLTGKYVMEDYPVQLANLNVQKMFDIKNSAMIPDTKNAHFTFSVNSHKSLFTTPTGLLSATSTNNPFIEVGYTPITVADGYELVVTYVYNDILTLDPATSGSVVATNSA